MLLLRHLYYREYFHSSGLCVCNAHRVPVLIVPNYSLQKFSNLITYMYYCLRPVLNPATFSVGQKEVIVAESNIEL